jgi:hypothetical protein
MPGSLQIDARPTVTADRPFACAVRATAAAPGDVITVRLEQTSGLAPFYSESADLMITSDGTGMHIFNVTLHGPCEARLVAEDVSSQSPAVSDDARVQVVP